jgi:hypothetical protein
MGPAALRAAAVLLPFKYCVLLVLLGCALCSVKEHAIALVRHFEAPIVIMHSR